MAIDVTMYMYLHLLGKAVRHTGLGVDNFVHERLSQAGVVQLVVAPTQGIKGNIMDTSKDLWESKSP